jgi:peptide chain release factor 1
MCAVQKRLESLELRLESINRMLMDPEILSNNKRLRDLSREHSTLNEVIEKWHETQALAIEIASIKEMLQDSDPEMREMAEVEHEELVGKLEAANAALKLLMLPKDPYEGRTILLEIRAGTGGDEAALFAADLYRMYSRYAENVGLKMEEISTSATGSGIGLKEIVSSVSGAAAYNTFRFESGVHRVQRVPATESQGRVHTSAATVAVLPEPDEIELKIENKDLRIDTMRAGGPGGQSVNTTDSAVRIVHIPTGLTVICQDEKSQLKNKAKAMRVLKARLLEKQEAEAHAKAAAERKAQVGSGDRSERIRTYNFPQNRLTDHRVNLTIYKLDSIIDGDLHEVVDFLTKEHQAKLLAAVSP